MMLKRGIESAGGSVRFSQKPDGSDVHVFWGLRRHWGREALDLGKPSILVERAYLGDRFKWFMLGWNGLNGMADFRNRDVPDDRMQRWLPLLKPWKSGGDYALVVGQVPGDSSLQGMDIHRWADSVIPKAREMFGRVVYRPHPNVVKRGLPNPRAATEIDSLPLGESLERASVCVTYSSNTGVDAVLAGVPTIYHGDCSMVKDVAVKGLSSDLVTPDRHEWLRRLAYTQWTAEELADGSAWRHIMRGGLC